MKRLNQLLLISLGFAPVAWVTGGTASAGSVRDVCVAAPTGGGSFNTFVFRDVPSLSRGKAISLQGIYFTTASQRLAPIHGTAAMGSDGTVRLGAFVHSTAQSLNDFTISGVTDANFVGTVGYDNDGDFKNNGTLVMELRECSTIAIP